MNCSDAVATRRADESQTELLRSLIVLVTLNAVKGTISSMVPFAAFGVTILPQ